MDKSYTASTISIALLLLLLGAVGYFMLGARQASAELAQGIKVTVFLDDEVSAEQKAAIESSIKADKQITSFKLLTADQATTEFEKNTGIIVDKILDDNPIPASYELTPMSIAVAPAIENRAKVWSGVVGTFYPQQISGQLTQKVDNVWEVAIYLGVMLLIITLSLMYYTLKLSILSSSEAIRTMQLVGARNSFIKRPYIKRAVVQGFAATILAIGIMILLIEFYGLQTAQQGVDDWAQIGMIGSVMCIVGVSLSTIFTTLALGFIVKKRLVRN